MLHTNGYPRPISTLAAPDAILGRLLASLYEVSFWLLIALAVLVPARAQTKTNLSRLIVVGDSLSAGFQNESLLDSQQPNGYASLVAAQAGVPLPLPLIAPPGIPNVLTLVSPGPPPVIVPAPGVSTGRDNPTIQAMDLAVPGANVQDALTTRPSFTFDNLTDFVLGLPGALEGISRSQIEWAENLAPTTILVWLGNNDALGAAIAADASVLTPVSSFQASYAEVMSRLRATGATLVVATIPDVTVVPFLTPADTVAAQVGLPLSFIGPILGIASGDFVTPDAFPLIQAILTGAASGPLPGNVVLDAGEVAAIQTAINAYNGIIASEAQANGAALVDIHALTAQFKASGVVVGGQRLTTGFLGGLFSLDGIHPTNTGYALIANEFIKVLNTQAVAAISPQAIQQIKMKDPLVLPGVGRPASALGQISADTAKSLRQLMVH
jgi:GDSL-like lipase/acylhydrolase family protein